MRLNRNLIVSLILALCLSAPRAFPGPATAPSGPHIVLIIRHAEKPEEQTDGEKDPNLSKAGFARADALAAVIPGHFPRPDYLLATKRSKGSNRPIETITPLSKALGEEIESPYKDDDYAQAAHLILTDPKYAGKTVLIAWHHGKIPELAKSLGVTDVPEKWNPSVFDRVWEITYENGKATMKDLPQRAMPGDAQE